MNKNSSQPNKVHNQEAVTQNEPQQEKKTKLKRQTKKKANRKNGILSSSERKTLEQLYSKGPASFGSPKRLHTQSKMSMAKVKSYLEAKPSFTKYRSVRLRFPRLRVIVKDINEIWSLDLAHVDRDVKYLLVAVDCVTISKSRTMKTKYATEAAQAFKKMIKYKQPLKVWVDDGTEFLGAFKSLCEKRGIHLYSTFSEKSLLLQNKTSLKNIIYRYLEEKWTYSYVDKLDQFVNTIYSRVNRVTKLAPNKVTKKVVPRLVSLSAQTSILQMSQPEDNTDAGGAITDLVFDENHQERRSWRFCNSRVPRSEVVYFTQIFIIVFLIAV